MAICVNLAYVPPLPPRENRFNAHDGHTPIEPPDPGFILGCMAIAVVLGWLFKKR